MNGSVREFSTSSQELDQLLWEVLWRPLGFPREVRKTFPIEGSLRELGYFSNGKLLGGAVFSGDAGSIVEFHHLAVLSKAQGAGVGSALVESVVGSLPSGTAKLVAWARSENASFFQKQGFRVLEEETFSPDLFARVGASLVRVELLLA
jgi:GNAT superfamily N-acetyltransferase